MTHNKQSLIAALEDLIHTDLVPDNIYWHRYNDGVKEAISLANQLDENVGVDEPTGWRHRTEWHDDVGLVLWVKASFNDNHDVYFGSPLCSDWDARFRYFRKLPAILPTKRLAQSTTPTITQEGGGDA